MIIEAFARYLHNSHPDEESTSVLGRWLWERLTLPAESVEDKVLRQEICVDFETVKKLSKSRNSDPVNYVFCANSESGRRLLKSLYEYALGFEQQKWSRFVHHVKASDFNKLVN